VNKVGDKILQLRNLMGWTQAELAEKLSVSDKTINRWEIGVENPEIWQLPEISKLFNVSVDYLLEVNGNEIDGKCVSENNKPVYIEKSYNQNNPNRTNYASSKGINMALLMISILMLISYFLPVTVVKGYVPLFGEITSSFSLIELFKTSTLYILIALLFFLSTIFEIINNTVLLSLNNDENNKYSVASKIGSVVSSLLLVIASVIFIIEYNYAYQIILIIISCAMLILSLIDLKTKSNNAQAKKNLLQKNK
jgi:transcriptional regulator with XRE-family HTH domain